MKNNKGVSLVTLIVTILVLIILSAITFYRGGIKNIDQAANVGVYTEALNVSDAVSSRTLLNRINPEKYPYIGKALKTDGAITINNIEYGDGWYQLTAEDSVLLGLEKVTRSYVINYSTGEVVSILPIKVDGNDYYALDELRPIIGKDNVQVSATQYDEIKGVNKPVIITGMIPVKNVDGNWIVASVDDSDWYDYSLETQRWATIMLVDELKVSGYTNEQIREINIFNLIGKTVESNGSIFVWIPRYSTRSDGSIIFSELTNDYNHTEANSIFGNLTGFWISQYEAGIVEQ